MLVRRVSVVIIAALLGGLVLAVPAQAIIDDGGGGGGGGGGPIPVTITLDDQKGSTSQINTEVGAHVSLPAATSTGYTFTGWWTSPAGGTKLPQPVVVTNNATYYAQWTVNSHTVTFAPENGAAATATTADYGTTISAPAQPSRTYYAFAGWFTSATGGTQVTFPYTVTGDATLHAHWTSTDVTLTADPQNGEEPKVITLHYAFSVVLAQPAYAGHTFAGWWTAPSGGTLQPYQFGVSSTTTVYAHWTLDSHSVTFAPENGAASTTATADYGTTIAAPAAPARAHYAFTGWFTAASGGTKATFPYTVTSDATLYAQWTIDSHTVTLQPGNGDAATPIVADYGTTVTAPTQPTRAGHTFTGWFTAASGGTAVTFPYTVSGDATLYAQWTVDSHTVTLQPGNGDAATPIVADYGTTIAAPAQPVRTGYTFTGWFTAASGGTAVTFPYSVTGDATIYAQWTIDSHVVTFEPGNGDASTSQTADYGTTIAAPAAPARAHYSFTGWFTAASGGTAVTFPYTVTGDTTIYAQWTIDSHTVTLQPGNGDAATPIVADYGTTIDAPSQPVRTGYTFTGWFTAASGGTAVAFPYTVNGDATIYAQWTVNSYPVTFEPGNGDASTIADYDFGSPVAAPPAPDRTSYTFTGWFTAETGGTEVAFPYTVAGDATFYAQWVRSEVKFSTPDQVSPGDTVPVDGEGFMPGEAIEIWLLSTPVKLATIVAGPDGTFSTTVVIPADTPAGSHHIEVRGTESGTLSHAVTVTESESLSSTGAEIRGMTSLAALLMLGGFALIIRRRRSA